MFLFVLCVCAGHTCASLLNYYFFFVLFISIHFLFVSFPFDYVLCVCLFSHSHSIAFISVVRLEIECVICVCAVCGVCVLKINGGIDDAFKIVKLKKMYTQQTSTVPYLIYANNSEASEYANTPCDLVC